MSTASIAAKSSGHGGAAARGGTAEHGQVPLADHTGKVMFTCVIPGPTQWYAQSMCDTEESVQSRILKTGYHNFFFSVFKEKSRKSSGVQRFHRAGSMLRNYIILKFAQTLEDKELDLGM